MMIKVSVFRKMQRTEHRKQMTEDKGQAVSVFCHLTSVICYLTPETRELTPKRKPCFANYLRDPTIGGQEPRLPIDRTHLKNRILVQDRGGAEFKTAGILLYVEDLKRGTNKDIGPKNIFEMGSN